MLEKESYTVYPIGYVKRGKKSPEIRLEAEYRPGLLEVDNFSHIIVVWWGDRYEEYRDQVDMRMKPPYALDVLTGLFATRSPVRPNPVNLSVCRITAVDHDEGVVKVNEIDAFDGTPVLDLKVYFPTSDRVRDPEVPERFSEWGDYIPVEGIPPEYYDDG